MKLKEPKSEYVKHRKPTTLVKRKPRPPPAQFSRDKLIKFVEVVVFKHKEKVEAIKKAEEEELKSRQENTLKVKHFLPPQ
ncbi:hypothetical protein MAR_036407, partial [Mya arenaria]